mgnify:CR=1 FL=1
MCTGCCRFFFQRGRKISRKIEIEVNSIQFDQNGDTILFSPFPVRILYIGIMMMMIPITNNKNG